MPDPYPIPQFGGARFTSYTADPADFDKAVKVNEFKDGSASYYRAAASGIRRFFFEYENLTDEEAFIHDSHQESCSGQWLGFDYYDPRTGLFLLTNVHYQSYEGNKHKVAWRRARSVVLIWRPLAGA